MNAISKLPIVSTHWDAIVIGGGVAGLSTAAFLATNRKKVLLLEQHSVLGGCSHVFRRKKQWEFDVGIHYIGDCGENGQVPRMFRGLGLKDRVEFLSMDATGYDTIVFPDLTVRVPYGWDNYLHNLIAAFPKEEKGLRKLVDVISSIGHAIDRSRSPGSTLGMMAFIAKSGSAGIWAMQPVSRLLDHCNLSPKARAVVSVQFGQYGCPPSRAPVLIHAGLLHNYIHGGAWYPKGGGQIFAGHLHNVLVNHGGLALTSASVQKIIIEQGRAVGVRMEGGEEFRAPVIVSAADIKKTYIDMVGVENLPSGLFRKVKKYRMTAPFLNVYLGVKVDLKGKIPVTNYFSMPSESNLEKMHEDLVDNALELSREAWMEQVRNHVPAFIHCGSIKDPG